MGNTKILCIISGPSEAQLQRRGKGGRGEDENRASVEVEVLMAGFAGMDRLRRRAGGRGADRYVLFVLSFFPLGGVGRMELKGVRGWGEICHCAGEGEFEGGRK